MRACIPPTENCSRLCWGAAGGLGGAGSTGGDVGKSCMHAANKVLLTASHAGGSRGLAGARCRVHRERPMSIDVTWLKPSLGERWWEAKWTAWKLQVPGKGGRKGYNRPWTTNGVEADTVQVACLAPLASVITS